MLLFAYVLIVVLVLFSHFHNYLKCLSLFLLLQYPSHWIETQAMEQDLILSCQVGQMSGRVWEGLG